VTPGEIRAEIAQSARVPDGPADRALLALRELLVQFIDATDNGCPESMRVMSIDQARLLNQLHLAVGL